MFRLLSVSISGQITVILDNGWTDELADSFLKLVIGAALKSSTLPQSLVAQTATYHLERTTTGAIWQG